MAESVNSYQPSFTGYRHPLKTLFKKGQMPSVKYGLYGEILNTENVSLEHLLPHSHGGATDLANLALATKTKNNARGNKPLSEVLNWDMLNKYLEQFNFKIKGFDGKLYQKLVRKTCETLGIVNPKSKVKKVPKKFNKVKTFEQEQLELYEKIRLSIRRGEKLDFYY